VAPLYAGLMARINANLVRPVGYLNTILYALPAATFRDIVGAPGPTNNSYGKAKGYNAGPDWDACTGLGSVNGQALRTALGAANMTTTVSAPSRSGRGRCRRVAAISRWPTNGGRRSSHRRPLIAPRPGPTRVSTPTGSGMVKRCGGTARRLCGRNCPWDSRKTSTVGITGSSHPFGGRRTGFGTAAPL
jgi:hypothetical protein